MNPIAWLLDRFANRAIRVPGTHDAAALNSTIDASLEGFDDPTYAIRIGYMVIFIGFGLFIVWAIFAPVGEGVPAQGVVVSESRRKVVSHLTGGTVTGVHVHENQSVTAGSVLLTLDSTRARSTHDALLNDYVATAARLARLTAEQTFANRIEFPEELRRQVIEIGREDVLVAQEKLFQVRQQAQESEQSILREGLVASQIQASGARQQLDARHQQAALLNREITSNRALVEEGYAPRNRLLEQERQLAELSSTTSDLRTRVARETSTASEIRLRLLQRKQEYLKEVESQAVEARRELSGMSERLKDARLELERTTVRAPVDGQVMSMLAQAPGTVVTPGAKLLEIVPAGDKLVFDVQVPVHVATRVTPGIETDIRITSFPGIPSLIVAGRVMSISSDRHEPQSGQPPYYLARVEVTPAGINDLGGKQLRSGMTADVIIKTGERSFMAYLLQPITRQLFSAFKEP